MVLDCSDASLEGPVLGRRIKGSGRHGLTPVVEHLGHMADSSSDLGGSQREIMILRTVEGGAQAADLLDHRPSIHSEMTDVHLAPEPLRGPARLVEGIDAAPGRIELVFVGIDHVDIVVLLGGEPADLDRTCRQGVVVVEECQELPIGVFDPIVGGGNDPTLLERLNTVMRSSVQPSRSRSTSLGCGPSAIINNCQSGSVWDATEAMASRRC